MPDRTWTCEHCQSKQTHELWCEACQSMRFLNREIAFCEHMLEHFADGIETPIDMLKAMSERPCYANMHFTLSDIARRMRMLTKDTTAIARALLKANADKMALNVVKHGDTKDHIQALKGIQVLGEIVEHKGELVTKHIVELHEGPPPRKES